MATALGHAAGNYVVAACVAVGLGALLERWAQAFLIVEFAGALYLIWLGVRAIPPPQVAGRGHGGGA